MPAKIIKFGEDQDVVCPICETLIVDYVSARRLFGVIRELQTVGNARTAGGF